MIALGIGVFVGMNMEWYSIDKNTAYLFDATGFADYRIVSEKGFSSEDADKIAALDGVDAVSRYLSIQVEVKEKQDESVALTVTENADVSGFLLMEGNAYEKDSKDGIWLSDKYAAANNISVGDTLTFLYANKEIQGHVEGLIKSGEYLINVRDESQLMPDYTNFGFAYISPAMYENAMGFAFYPQLNVISTLSKEIFTENVDDALQSTSLILTKDETVSYAQANGEKEEGRTMGSVLPFLFLVIAILTMVTTMHRITSKEKTQIGTLKALGFKDRRILRHYTSYAFTIGLIGSALGIGFGYFLAWYIMNPSGSMGTYLDMPTWDLYLPGFCIYILIGILILLTLIGFLSVKEMLKGTAADALRPYTPKKMKNLFIERTRLFHMLPFGTRWNLRDTIRHKSRTAMSLIGIIGCMTIMVGCLGMRDTMDEFLDISFGTATNYASRIFLTEDATEADADRLLNEYNADRSASVSIQSGDKAVSLDIYDITHDTVRFIDRQSNTVALQNDGAYICSRIAEDRKLKVGDTFTVNPYGSDDTYTLRVAGILHSMSENVVVTASYADTLKIPYTFSSLYTAVEKQDIAADDAIKSIQSKQMIMDSFDVFTEIMNLMISLMVIVAMILGIVVLYNLGVMSYTERYREMATLKVLGFRDKKIGALLIDQNLWVTLLGILIGIPAGRAALQYLLKKLAGEYEMNMAIYPASYLISIVLTFGVSLLVSIMVSRKNKKKRLDLPTASFSFYPILFCKQSCGQVSVTGIGEQNHDGLALIFGTLCQFYCCMYGCTGRNTD